MCLGLGVSVDAGLPPPVCKPSFGVSDGDDFLSLSCVSGLVVSAVTDFPVPVWLAVDADAPFPTGGLECSPRAVVTPVDSRFGTTAF